MRMRFELDGCYALTIGGDMPRPAGSPESVGVQVDYTPLPAPELAYSGNSGGESVASAIMGRPETRCLVAFSVKPSHARAIASALLSAATEAKS